jgi:hypothetical protein
VANKAVHRARRYVPHLSNYHEVLRCTKQVEITLADPVFDPQDQIGRKFFWCPERLISAIGMESFSSERVVQTTSKRYSPRRIDTTAPNRTTSVESGFGRGHPVPKPIEPVDFAPHAESIGFGVPFVDQLGGAFAVVGCIAVQ